MKKRALLFILLGLITISEVMAQNTGRFPLGTGRTFTVTDQGMENLQFLREAEMHLQLADFESAFLSLESAVAQNPYSADALLRRANLKNLLGMHEDAALDKRRAQQINPYAADLYGYNGPFSPLNVLSYNPEQATAQLAANFRYDDYYNYLDYNFLGEKIMAEEAEKLESIIWQMEEQQYFDALEGTDEILQFNPESVLAHDLKGVIYLKQKDLPAAAASFEKAVEIQPDFAIGWYNLSQVARQEGRFAQAEEWLNTAIHLQENLTEAYFDRALVRKARGDKEGALQDYNAVIQKTEGAYLEAYLNRGLTRKMLGDYGGALADLDKAILNFPDRPDLYKNRGNIYLLFGDYFRAVMDYTKAIELDSDYAEAYYNRGLAHILLLDPASGCQDLSDSAQLGYARAEEKIKYFCVD
jgi:tetratricopeptide (TPR) repeat protein